MESSRPPRQGFKNTLVESKKWKLTESVDIFWESMGNFTDNLCNIPAAEKIGQFYISTQFLIVVFNFLTGLRRTLLHFRRRQVNESKMFSWTRKKTQLTLPFIIVNVDCTRYGILWTHLVHCFKVCWWWLFQHITLYTDLKCSLFSIKLTMEWKKIYINKIKHVTIIDFCWFFFVSHRIIILVEITE